MSRVSSVIVFGGLVLTAFATPTVAHLENFPPRSHVGALLVLANHKLVRIISERDYARKVILRGKSSKLMEVQEIMTTPVTSVAPENTIQDCMKIMTEKRIRHLPVIENEKLLGVVSIGDLVKWIISAQAETIQHLEHYISNAYPGSTDDLGRQPTGPNTRAGKGALSRFCAS